jgi:hypothetical protein
MRSDRTLNVSVRLLLLLVSLVPAAALARRTLPIAVQIEGYMGAKPAGVTLQATWTVSVRGARHQLHVATLRVLRGNVSYFKILSALEPYKVALQINGREPVLAALTSAPAGVALLISGNLTLRGGPGILHVDSVRPLDKPAAGLTSE